MLHPMYEKVVAWMRAESALCRGTHHVWTTDVTKPPADCQCGKRVLDNTPGPTCSTVRHDLIRLIDGSTHRLDPDIGDTLGANALCGRPLLKGTVTSRVPEDLDLAVLERRLTCGKCLQSGRHRK